ncbi:MAG: Conserved protein YunE [Candidatus Nomurabacteria bacterium GW2011_GWB1_37_5]|uniref:Probable membrane transporter protein n=1 Tax=Candidatus Nomurabacteria bacterium GW2011_GWB1_37_5 TaxID=1618742 RepID=A0A0G0GXT8_9BACT|nr:MAG: Conserved protein YunE [Candidatus Nomurabacteria bacterium GW2011_GWB1_37_5]
MTLNLIILGLFTGVITGMTGASGVMMVVPVLTTFFDQPLRAVLGTSLLVDVIASASVAYMFWRNRHVDFKSGVWLLVGSLLGAQLGSIYVVSVSRLIIFAALALGMIFFGLIMWRTGVLHHKPKVLTLPNRWLEYLQTPIWLIIIGVLIGLSTGIFGAGGGVVIFIVLFSILQLPVKTAIGTSTFIMFLTALSGVVGYFENGNLDLRAGMIIGVAAAFGGIFSSVIANRIRDDVLAKLIGAFFIFLALVMFLLKVVLPLLGY